MSSENTALIDPTIELEGEFLSMAAEYARSGDQRYRKVTETGFAAYVRRLRDNARGIGLEPDYVPWSTYWLVGDGRAILGVSRLRHELNESLLNGGGHIGYDIRPSERRRGYGTRILALTLERARSRGLKRALVTCLTDNAASARIIENNGGVLEDEIFSKEMRGPLKRYWIDL